MDVRWPAGGDDFGATGAGGADGEVEGFGGGQWALSLALSRRGRGNHAW